MIYTIENDFLKVGVREHGAELCSLESKKTGKEYIWQADPEVWAGSAPVLFPMIGGLKDGEYLFEEKTYTMPKHGFFKENSDVKLINRVKNRMSFLLSSNEETLACYPFEFDFKISFLLMDNRLQVFHEVVNLDQKSIYFSIGAHPAFNLPWRDEVSMEDHFLEFDTEEDNSYFVVSEEGLLSKKEIPALKNSKKLPLTKNMFDNDALIFTEINSSEVSIKVKGSKDKITVNYDDFPFLGIWSKPGAKFLCIEPWDGLPDFNDSEKELISKPGMIKLLTGDTHYASYTIQISEV